MRRTVRKIISSGLGVLLATGVASTAATERPVPAAEPVPVLPTEGDIAALFGTWNTALRTGDATRVANRYAPDAVLLPTLSNTVRRTRAEIIDYFMYFLQSQPEAVIKESSVHVLGEHAALDTGIYAFSLTKEGERQRVEARYTFGYERRDGRWLIVSHHSSAMPELA